MLGLSVDAVADHKNWARDVEDVGGGAINYPLLADPELDVAKLYGRFNPKADPIDEVKRSNRWSAAGMGARIAGEEQVRAY